MARACIHGFHHGNCDNPDCLRANEKLHIALVLGEVRRERLSQNKKWGEQNRDLGRWCAILGEEFGEFCKAATEYLAAEADFIENYNDLNKPHRDWKQSKISMKIRIAEARKEAVQVSAVAASIVEAIDRIEGTGQ